MSILPQSIKQKNKIPILLEARLGATSVGLTWQRHEQTLSALAGMVSPIGIRGAKGRVFEESTCAPVSDDESNALLHLFESRWSEIESEPEPEDRIEFQRFCDPQSSDCILNHPDYRGFFTYSMFWRKVPL